MKAVVHRGPFDVATPEVDESAPEAYEHLDKRLAGWTKVLLHPAAA